MTPEQREELKPCPFCGGSVTLERAMRIGEMGPRDWWGVKCRNTMNLGGTCAIEQIPSGSAEAAVERWNRRAQVEALTVPQWISVEDRLPDPRKQILMIGVGAGAYGNYTTDYYAGWIEESGKWARWPHPTQPSHWAHLPAAPTIPAIPGTKEGA